MNDAHFWFTFGSDPYYYNNGIINIPWTNNFVLFMYCICRLRGTIMIIKRILQSRFQKKSKSHGMLKRKRHQIKSKTIESKIQLGTENNSTKYFLEKSSSLVLGIYECTLYHNSYPPRNNKFTSSNQSCNFSYKKYISTVLW